LAAAHSLLQRYIALRFDRPTPDVSHHIREFQRAVAKLSI